ncbi:vitamin K epoxide reductase family protein [Conexibacter sp. DBS9H8]|uniref:vitamin K epoxide reductase family protein n=1 Tax=Conexibacter sp. DBS9H8 TaxID=2937801 RepID=UPI00200D0297|nr:vitamin K epoxide reductase family protein [Conexibacter sp. DBS9H8]
MKAQAKTTGRARFQAPAPIATRPEPRIGERGAARAERPARSKLTVAIVVFTVIGLLDAGYLTYIHFYGLSALLCFGKSHGHSSCLTVQSSQWSSLAGIPVAILGLIGYLILLVSLRIPGEWGRLIGFGTALIGFLFSLYLTYREAFSIHAYCEWCLGSATCLTVLAVLTGIRFLRTPPGA